MIAVTFKTLNATTLNYNQTKEHFIELMVLM